MIDIAIINDDLVINSYGDIALDFTENDDIIQMANSSIKTIKGENIFHQQYGNDAWNKRLKISDSGFAVVEDCSKEAILAADNRLEDVTYIHAYSGEEYGQCCIEYTLLTVNGDTVDGRTSINIL